MGYSALPVASGGGLPTDSVIILCGASAELGVNLGFAVCDGVQVMPISIKNGGGEATAAYILDSGGGANSTVMAERLIDCLEATFTAAGSDLTVNAGEGPSVEIHAGATGVLVASRTPGLAVS